MSNFKVTFSANDLNNASYRDYEERNLSNFSNNRGNRGGGGRRGGGSRGRGRGGPYVAKKYNKNKHYQGSYNNNRGPTPRSRFDDDEDMGDLDGAGPSRRDRFTPYNRFRGGKQNRRLAMDDPGRSNALKRLGLPVTGSGNRSQSHTDSGWWKITIPYGAKASKDFVLKALTETSEVPFVPIEYNTHKDNTTVSFFVSDKLSALALLKCKRKITMPSGHKLMILAKPSSPPELAVEGPVLENLKVTMSNRYDPPTKALDMSNFQNDSSLKQQDIHLPINKNKIMATVVKIIGEHIPELEALDISDNNISYLDQLADLASKTANLKKLNLGCNKIKSIREVEKLKQLPIEELYLDKNPLCNSFSEEKLYISAVRKIFPKVLRLDGNDLPPPITFELDTPTALPPTKGSHFETEQARNLVCMFLDQYFSIYDMDKRQSLLDAYHDQAIFSLSVFYNPVIQNQKQTNFGDYISESRNLLRVPDSARRNKCLKHGKLNIVALLNQLPATQHDPSSFIVDVTLVTPSLMSFTVTGMFKEVQPNRDDHHLPVRHFVRTFITAPQGSGIVIVNEELTLTNATNSQRESMSKQEAPTPASSPALDPQAGPSGVPTGLPTPQIQQEMISQFSIQSGMNKDFSEKCLVQNNWDYNKAAVVFTELKEAGKIPPEAFIN